MWMLQSVPIGKKKRKRKPKKDKWKKKEKITHEEVNE